MSCVCRATVSVVRWTRRPASSARLTTPASTQWNSSTACARKASWLWASGIGSRALTIPTCVSPLSRYWDWWRTRISVFPPHHSSNRVSIVRLRSSCVSTFPPRRCWTTPWRWRRSPPAKNLIWFWTWTVLLAWLLSTYSAILAASLGIHVVFFSVYGLFADGLFVCLPFRRREEAQEYIEIGTINGLFVLGRCTGFIGTCASGFNSAFSSVVLIHHHIYVFILLSFEQQQATIWIKSDWSKDSTAIRGTTFPTSCRKSIPNRRKEGKVAFQKKTEELFVVRCDKRFEKKKRKKNFWRPRCCDAPLQHQNFSLVFMSHS